MKKSGFTLIELSIALVIIGLLVGGIMAGQELITQSKIRAQVSQLQRYNTIVNSFKLKYGGLPGDLLASRAATFGFTSSGQGYYQNNNDGWVTPSLCCPGNSLSGESGIFWRHLTESGLLEGRYVGVPMDYIANLTATQVGDYVPRSKMGNDVYVLVSSMWGTATNCHRTYCFGLYRMQGTNGSGYYIGNGGVTAIQAHAIDTKLDDGVPDTGRIWGEGRAANGGMFVDSWTNLCTIGASTPRRYNLAATADCNINVSP